MENVLSAGRVSAGSVERAEFIRKTYLHLALAILAFVGIEYWLLRQPFAMKMAVKMVTGYNWLIVLGLYMVVGWLADRMAHSNASKGTQYLGLGLYVAIEAVIFMPLLLVAIKYTTPDVLPTALVITGTLFAGLTFIVLTTRKDFSFLGGILKIGFFVAMGVIIASIVFGFSLGLVFSGAMVVLASIAILYTTSKVLREYGSSQYVGAALALFAAVALLFWYVLRIVIALSGRD